MTSLRSNVTTMLHDWQLLPYLLPYSAQFQHSYTSCFSVIRWTWASTTGSDLFACIPAHRCLTLEKSQGSCQAKHCNGHPPCGDCAQLCLALAFPSEYSCSGPVTLLCICSQELRVEWWQGMAVSGLYRSKMFESSEHFALTSTVSWAFCSDLHRVSWAFCSNFHRGEGLWSLVSPCPSHLKRCSLLLLLTANTAHPHPVLCQWECLLLEEGSRCNSTVN